MLEARTFVDNVEHIKKALEKEGAIFKGEYRCRDLIFVPNYSDKSYGEEFLRLRVNEKNIWNGKDVVIVVKKNTKKRNR